MNSGAAIPIVMCFLVFRLTCLCPSLQLISLLHSTTLTNYRSLISKVFSALFGQTLSDSSRVKAVIDGYGKDHPSQTQWKQDQTWDPGCIVAYWARQPDNDALSTAELALKSWSLFAVACWPRCSDGARLV